jgi:hypothetical protein
VASALRLISAKGALVTFRHYPPTGPTTQDRIRGTVTDDGHVDYLVSAVGTPIKMPRAGASNAGGGTGLLISDMRTVYVAGAGWTTLDGTPVDSVLPHKADQVLGLEGINWTVELASGLAPSGPPYILFTLRVTR